jgi:hypothetical protein
MHALVLAGWLLGSLATNAEEPTHRGLDAGRQLAAQEDNSSHAPTMVAPTIVGESSLFVRSRGADIQVLGAGPTGQRCFPPLAEHPMNTPLVLNITAARAAVGQPGRDGATQEADYILLCSCPKAASLTLRSIATASRRGKYRRVPNIFDPELPYVTKARDLKLLYGHMWFSPPPRVRRLMWVRHPVARILHGNLQVNPKLTEEAFFQTVSKGLHRPNHPYDSSCGRATQTMSTHGFFQHYIPPQHCRCGIPCGAAYEVYRIEDRRQSIRSVLLGYGVPTAWLPGELSAGESSHSTGHGVDESRWLNARVLAMLNNITSLEQRLLGYRPYRLGVAPDALLV